MSTYTNHLTGTTYTDLHKKIKESVMISCQPGLSSYGVTEQLLKLYNQGNRYYGTFIGNIELCGMPLTGTHLCNVVIENSEFIGKVNFPGGVTINSITSDITATRQSINNEVHRAKQIESNLSNDILNEYNRASRSENEISVKLEEKLKSESESIRQNLSVCIEKNGPNASYIASYHLSQGGKEIGVIDIPKDFLVKSGDLKTCEKDDIPVKGLKIGDKYLDLVINAKDAANEETHVYISLKDIVKPYTGTMSDEICVSIDNDNQIKATILNSSISPEKLQEQYALSSSLSDYALSSSLKDEMTLRKANDDFLSDQIDLKVTGTLTSITGRSRIFNEKDGGGAKFEGSNGITSFVGVHDYKTDVAVAGQMYVKSDDGTVKLNMYKDKFTYVTGDTPTGDEIKEDREIAVKKDIADVSSSLSITIDEELGVIQNDISYVSSEVSSFSNEWKESVDLSAADISAYAENLNDALVQEIAERAKQDNTKVDKEVPTGKGIACIFNEKSGGGAKIEDTANNIWSFAGVNQPDEISGSYGSLYVVETLSATGARLKMFKDGFNYKKDSKNWDAFETSAEIAVRQDIDDAKTGVIEHTNDLCSSLSTTIDKTLANYVLSNDLRMISTFLTGEIGSKLDEDTFNQISNDIGLSNANNENLIATQNDLTNFIENDVVAEDNRLGLVKTGYAENDKNYPVKLSNEQMYVYVPWTGGSASDVAVDNITIEKGRGPEFKISVKSIASLSNDLTSSMATKAFVNSSIATNTAYFKGTYETSADLVLSVKDATPNDYAFVTEKSPIGDVSAYNRYKYTVKDEVSSWIYEYTLNNSSFTQEQWDTINSKIDSNDKETLISVQQNIENWNETYDKTKDIETFGDLAQRDITSVVGAHITTYVDGGIKKLSAYVPTKISEFENDNNYLSTIPVGYKKYDEIKNLLSTDGYVINDSITTAKLSSSLKDIFQTKGNYLSSNSLDVLSSNWENAHSIVSNLNKPIPSDAKFTDTISSASEISVAISLNRYALSDDVSNYISDIQNKISILSNMSTMILSGIDDQGRTHKYEVIMREI